MKKTLVALVVCASIFSCKIKMNKPIVIGHRGAMGHETENTVASIEKAIELGVDMIEIDVFAIQSGEIVVFHDETLERLTDGKGNIEEYTLEELQKLTLTGNHQIPTLRRVLDVINAGVKLNIELKGARTAKKVDEIMQEYIGKGNWFLDDFIISSFNWDELKTMRSVNSSVPIAILTEKDPVDAITIGKELQAVAINPDHKNLNSENNIILKDAGFKLYPWTVNEPQDIIRMKRLGVDGIITNFPERIK